MEAVYTVKETGSATEETFSDKEKAVEYAVLRSTINNGCFVVVLEAPADDLDEAHNICVAYQCDVFTLPEDMIVPISKLYYTTESLKLLRSFVFPRDGEDRADWRRDAECIYCGGIYSLKDGCVNHSRECEISRAHRLLKWADCD